MQKKIITGTLLLLFAALPAFAGTVEIPKTGQTTSYAAGDDGDLEMGVAWPIPRFTDNLDGTVKDELTGLEWTKNANLMVTRDPGFDTDDTARDGRVTWQHALDYVAKLNAESYLGHTDWRLPNVNELKSLIDNSRYGPALPSGHPFTNVQSFLYWSSTTFSNYTDSAWVVYVYDGLVNLDYKSNSYSYAWPVRSGQVTLIKLSSFTADPKSGEVVLEWTNDSELDNAGFNLYRSESENGAYVTINASLIPAEGSPTQGATYEFVDRDVKLWKTYFYKLEDVDFSGRTTMHGPVSAVPRFFKR